MPEARGIPVQYGPWRKPGVESTTLFPGLVVCDDRVTGSITAGRTRLPLWAFVTSLIEQEAWDRVNADYDLDGTGLTLEQLATFLYCLLEMRGEFGRLLLILADAERRESAMGLPWWDKKRDRKRVADALRRCLAVVDDSAGRSVL